MRLTPQVRRGRVQHMDATEAATIYGDAILRALDATGPQIPPAMLVKLALAMQANLSSALQQPELLAPTAHLLTELARRGSDALENHQQAIARSSAEMAETVERILHRDPPAA